MKKRVIGLLIIIYCLLCCIKVDADFIPGRLEVKVGGTLNLDLKDTCKIVECTSADSSLLEASVDSNICKMKGINLGTTRVNVKCEEEGKSYNLPVAVLQVKSDAENNGNSRSDLIPNRLEVKVGGTLNLDLKDTCKIVECSSADSLLEAYADSNICKMKGISLGETKVNVKCEGGTAYNLPAAVLQEQPNSGSADVNVELGKGKTVFQKFSCKISECTSSNSALAVEANKDLNMCWGTGVSLGNAEVTVKCEDGKQNKVNVAVVEAKADENTNGNSGSNDIYDHVEDKKIECSSFELLMKDINGIFDIVKIIIPILIVVVSTYDFIRAVAGKVEGDTKKAFMKFIKRLVFAIIFFFLPTILNFFLGLIDPSYSTCVDLPK